MVQLDPHTLYTLKDLETICAENGIRARRFLDQVRPEKVARDLFWGAALIKAIDRFTQERERQRDPVTGRRRRRRYLREGEAD